MSITKRKKETLKLILDSIEENGYPPTLSELRGSLRVNSNQAVLDHLVFLEREGYIKREGTARGIKVLEKSYELLETDSHLIPVLGSTSAGSPVSSEQYLEDWVKVSTEVSKPKNDIFLIKVHGDSMIGAGIYDGDLVMIQPTSEAKNNDIILAYMNGETTVKRLVKKLGKNYLRPENPKYKDIKLAGVNDFQIQGKVVGVIRSI